MHETELDLLGLKCPLPALKTAKALKSIAPGCCLTVVCNDPMAIIDIPNLVQETGDQLLEHSTMDGRLTFKILRRSPA